MDFGIGRRRRDAKTAPVQAAATEVDYVSAGDRARDARDWPAAARAYGAALEKDDSLYPIWVQCGHARKESGDLPGAEAAYRRALDLAPEDADIHLQLGHALKLQGRPDQAVESYLNAVELAPNESDAFQELRTLSVQGILVSPERLHALIAKMTSPLFIAASTKDVGSLARQSQDTLQALLTALAQEDGGVSPAEIAALKQVAKTVGSLADRLRAARPGGQIANLPPLVFEVTDLIHHFRNGNTLTGIQRVQLHIVEAVIASDPETLVCCLARDRWVQIPVGLFQLLGRLNRAGAAGPAPDWQATAKHLSLLLDTASRMPFPRGAVLVNLGTSWGAGYMLHIRNAKREFGVRYVPFVHDVIPLLLPQFCVKNTVRSYVGWLADLFPYADLFLANSNNTRDDLIRVAAQRGVTLTANDVVVIPLDADLRNPSTPDHPPPNELGDLPYVLFVSTVEPRKNHIALLEAWERLISEIGLEATPILVCVGARGWKNKAIFQYVEASPSLSKRVVFLEGAPDPDVAALYRNCLFSVYPSLYEGWGLPVTESLCYGKVPLLSRVASLPEAGGEFADYFEIGSNASLTAALRKLIADKAYRAAREQAIAERFRARTWSELSAQILQAVAARFPYAGAASMPPPLQPPRAAHGHYYSLAANKAVAIEPGMSLGEVFRLGHGWAQPEDWGSWTRPSGASLAMLAPPGPTQVYLRLRGSDHRRVRIRLQAGESQAELELRRHEVLWVPFAFEVPADGHGLIHLRDISPSAFSKLSGVVWPDYSFGVAGFYLCDPADIEGRLRFMETQAAGEPEEPPDQDD